MSLIKWSTPFEEMDLLRKEMEGLLSTPGSNATSDFSPPVEVVETEGNYQIRFLLPGLPQENLAEHVHLDATQKTLTITGEIPPRNLQPTEKLLINQFRRGSFYKQLSFPDGIDHENIQANYRNGLLEVTLPKAMASQKRTIQIQVG